MGIPTRTAPQIMTSGQDTITPTTMENSNIHMAPIMITPILMYTVTTVTITTMITPTAMIIPISLRGPTTHR